MSVYDTERCIKKIIVGLSYKCWGHNRHKNGIAKHKTGDENGSMQKSRRSFEIVFDRYPTCLRYIRGATMLSQALPG